MMARFQKPPKSNVEAFAGLGVIFLIFVIIFLFIGSPLLFIWCCNELFNTQIEYTASNWFVSLLFLILVRGGSTSATKKG